MKFVLDPFLRRFLCKNDPAPVEPPRVELLLSNILRNVEETPQLTPQPAPRQTVRPWRFWAPSFGMPAPSFALALAALLLGLWVGQEVPLQTVVSTEAEVKAPVLAMADPWQSFVAVEEE